MLSTLSEWLGDAACNRNPTVLLMAGMIYSHEGMYDEALKACHVGLNLELWVLSPPIHDSRYLMHRLFFTQHGALHPSVPQDGPRGQGRAAAQGAIHPLLSLSTQDPVRVFDLITSSVRSRETIQTYQCLTVAPNDLQAMTNMDDDATITQLATAWVGVALVSGCTSFGSQWCDFLNSYSHESVYLISRVRAATRSRKRSTSTKSWETSTTSR